MIGENDENPNIHQASFEMYFSELDWCIFVGSHNIDTKYITEVW